MQASIGREVSNFVNSIGGICPCVRGCNNLWNAQIIAALGKMKMNTEINYIGDYRFGSNTRHREPYWASRICSNGVEKCVADAAGATENGRNVVRLLPYGPNEHALDGVVQDGDLLSYMQDPLTVVWPVALNPASIVNILKGRASHAELGYVSADGSARQVSLWSNHGPIRPYDRPFFEHACDDAISIYRISLRGYGVGLEREAKLKSEVKRWKQILQPVYFPCETMNVDPVDFTTVEELRRIAEVLIKHSPNDGRPPFDFKLNCVQWSTMVFSLAICFPLSREMLAASGMLSDYERNWSALLGFADEGLMGLDELPMPFYSVKEAVENVLDLYLPEARDSILGMVDMPAVAALLCQNGIRLDQRVTMPSAFMIENRLRALGVPRKTKSVFEYVATGVPAQELIKV